MDIVFQNYDICHNIWIFLDAPTINSLASVCKLFNQLNKDLYNTKLEDDIVIPAKDYFDRYMEETNDLIYFWDSNLMSTNILINCINNLNSLLGIFIDKNLWIALVNDFDLMESLFVHLVFINNAFTYYNTYPNLNSVFQSTHYSQMKKLCEKIQNYLYVENPKTFSNTDLKQMAKFKRIKKYYKMNRSKLLYHLKRPKHELYFLK